LYVILRIVIVRTRTHVRFLVQCFYRHDALHYQINSASLKTLKESGVFCTVFWRYHEEFVALSCNYKIKQQILHYIANKNST